MDLTANASNGLIDPVIGREKEVERIVQILCRRTKNNPILLGQAGVGKTAIAEGLAIRISDANVPVFLLVGSDFCKFDMYSVFVNLFICLNADKTGYVIGYWFVDFWCEREGRIGGTCNFSN